MNSSRVLQGFGGLSLFLGCLSVWYAFQRQMCSGGGECAPNIVYLIPGVLAVLLGVSLAVFAYRRSPAKNAIQA